MLPWLLAGVVVVNRRMRRLVGSISGPVGLVAVATLVVGGALAFPERSLAAPPVFTSVPPNVLVEADAWGGATVDFTVPTATDDGGYAGVECDAYPGRRLLRRNDEGHLYGERFRNGRAKRGQLLDPRPPPCAGAQLERGRQGPSLLHQGERRPVPV